MNFVQELEPGALLPDCVLTNQSGQAFHLGEFKGRALAFTFFFSRCPLPTFCPLHESQFCRRPRGLTIGGHPNKLAIAFHLVRPGV